MAPSNNHHPNSTTTNTTSNDVIDNDNANTTNHDENGVVSISLLPNRNNDDDNDDDRYDIDIQKKKKKKMFGFKKRRSSIRTNRMVQVPLLFVWYWYHKIFDSSPIPTKNNNNVLFGKNSKKNKRMTTVRTKPLVALVGIIFLILCTINVYNHIQYRHFQFQLAQLQRSKAIWSKLKRHYYNNNERKQQQDENTTNSNHKMIVTTTDDNTEQSSNNDNDANNKVVNGYINLNHDSGNRSNPAWTEHIQDQFDYQRKLLLAQLKQSTNKIQEDSGNDDANKRHSIRTSIDTILTKIHKILQLWSIQYDYDITHNVNGGVRWIRPYLLPPNPDSSSITTENDTDDTVSAAIGIGPNSKVMKKKKQRIERLLQSGRGNSRKEMKYLFFSSRMKTIRRTNLIHGNHNNHDDDATNAMKEQQHQQTTTTQYQRMKWEDAYDELVSNGTIYNRPQFDYTNQEYYTYPSIDHLTIDNVLESVVTKQQQTDGTTRTKPLYPPLKTLHELMNHFPQDDNYPQENLPIQETLFHFDYKNQTQLNIAAKLRDYEVPFKLYNVPEVLAASQKWTDDYLTIQFDGHSSSSSSTSRNRKIRRRIHVHDDTVSNEEEEQEQDKRTNHNNRHSSSSVLAHGTAQESINNYFAFYVPQNWIVETMGIPPVRNNDWTFEKWSQHALYADQVQLHATEPHFYWQSGVDPNERYIKDETKWTFISQDLPSFSSTSANFFLFHPEQQKGIQCRFGERGVVAATHYDGGRNMIAMMTGAKRYILSPPNQCSKLGIFTSKYSPIFRHSLLNFGHIQHLQQNGTSSTTNHTTTKDDDSNNSHDDNDRTTTPFKTMSNEERAWLQRASTSLAVETILKAGEVLYVPSHWFHYIVSLQKSAQCNVRSGIDENGNIHFGGRQHVEQCM